MEEVKEDKLLKKYTAWRDRVEKKENTLTEAIFKLKVSRDKLWRSCPHKWGYITHEHPCVKAQSFLQCGVCGGLMVRKGT